MKSFEARGYNPDSMPGLPEVPAIVEFGRFKVVRHRRELLADDRPVELGGRAFDTLMALIDARGTVLDKNQLMSLVWPDRVVEENNLPAQIAVLRKVFGADRHLIRTVAGRGYQFTGEIRATPATSADRSPPSRMTNLPEAVSELIGREAELNGVAAFVTERSGSSYRARMPPNHGTLPRAASRRRQPPFAGASTGSRSQSSSPRRASLGSVSMVWPPAWMTGSGCSPAAAAHYSVTRRCARRSTGATSYCPNPSGWSCAGWESSSGPSR